jgi:Putative beta-barrel porin 2
MRAGVKATASVAALATALALSPGAASVAQAQYTATEPPKSRFRVGPLRLTPKLELRNAGRDSNATLDPANPLPDTSVVVRGTVDGFVPVRRRLRLFGQSWLDWSQFRRLSSESSADPGADGRAEIDVGPFTLVGGGGALQARQLYSIDIDERILRQERWVNAGAEWRLTRRFLLSGGAEQRNFRVDPSTRTAKDNLGAAASLDRNSLTGTVALRYKLTSMTTLLATGDVIEDEFVLSSPGLQTTRSFRYLGGVELGDKAFISGRFLAGVRDFPVSSSGSLPSYRGPAFSAELALPIVNRFRLTGTLQRDVYVSIVSAALARARDAYVLTHLGGGADVDLPLQLVGRVSLGFSNASYLLPTLVEGVPFPHVEHLYSVGGSLLRHLSENVLVGGTVSYERRVSTIPGNSYGRWVYGVSAQVFP